MTVHPLNRDRQRAVLTLIRERLSLVHHPGRSLLIAGGSTLEQRWALAALVGQTVLQEPVADAQVLTSPSVRRALEGDHPDVDVLDGDPFIPDVKRALNVDVDELDVILILLLLSQMWGRIKRTDEALLRTHLKIKGRKVDADSPLYEFHNAVVQALDTLYAQAADVEWGRPSAEWLKNAQALLQSLSEIERARKSTVLKVEWIRDWNQDVRKVPAQSPLRLCALLGANRFNTSSANALLRTLEEPPSTTVTLLGAWHPPSLLSTIRSRCLAIDLGQPITPMDDGAIRAAHTFLSRLFLEPLGALRSDGTWIQTFDSSRRRPGEAAALAPDALVHTAYAWLHEALRQRYGLPVDPEYADHPLLTLLASRSLSELRRLGRFLDSRLAALKRNANPDLLILSVITTLIRLADPERAPL